MDGCMYVENMDVYIRTLRRRCHGEGGPGKNRDRATRGGCLSSVICFGIRDEVRGGGAGKEGTFLLACVTLFFCATWCEGC